MSKQKNLPIDQRSNDFKAWLTSKKGYSSRAKSDCLARCRRIERELDIDLSDFFQSAESFSLLMANIKQYAKDVSENSSSQYTLTGTLRNAARKYALFSNPKLKGTFEAGNYGQGIKPS